jgi:hypothetical protein
MSRKSSQQSALQFADEVAARIGLAARERIEAVLAGASCPLDLYEAALSSVRLHARVVLHFHPDRIGTAGVSVVEALLADGRYRSQFETGLSGGSLTAFPGGHRDEWERALFGGAYHGPGGTTADRPRYGALELVRYPDGPIPRFGSCYLVLRPSISARTTFTFSGSEHPEALDRLGTIHHLDAVMAPLLEEISRGEGTTARWPPFIAPTLGIPGLTVPRFQELLISELPANRADPSVGQPGRVLDSCVEAQVHGPVVLKEDAELLVADPSFLGTRIGELLTALASTHGIELRWHRGFQMTPDEVPAEFRGPAVRDLAFQVAGTGVINAAAIGSAAPWLLAKADERSRADVLQHIKQLWHVLVHFGSPIA